MKNLFNILIVAVLIAGIVLSGYLFLNPDSVDWSDVFNQQSDEQVAQDDNTQPDINTPTNDFKYKYKTTVANFTPDSVTYFGFEYCPADSGCVVYGVKRSFFSFVPNHGDSYLLYFNDYAKCETLEEQEYCRLLGYFKYKKEI